MGIPKGTNFHFPNMILNISKTYSPHKPKQTVLEFLAQVNV